MLKSMTGFGRCENATDEYKISVEMKAVNHRYLDLSIKMPKKFNYFEAAIRTLLKKYIQRGKVDIFINYEDYTEGNLCLKYNRALAAEYMEHFKRMEEEFHIPNDIHVSTLARCPEVLTMEVRGRNLVTGLPKTIVVSSEETLEALREPALQIVDAVHNVLERTPPELAADIFDRGIVMTGGGSLLSGLDALIEEKTGINTVIAEDPLTAVAIGTGKFIEFAHGMTSALEASMGIGGGKERDDY